MNHYKDFDQVRDFMQKSGSEDRITALNASATNGYYSAPQEGISAEVTGSHAYVKLDLATRLTSSNVSEDRRKVMRLIGDLAVAFRDILLKEGGELLEAQGPVTHGFIPSESNNSVVCYAALSKIMMFVDRHIKPLAGSDYRKCTAAFSFGPTIFAGSADLHKDQSVVSLARAANAPAKVLWKHSDSWNDKSIREIHVDGSLVRLEESNTALSAINSSAEMIKVAQASRAYPSVTVQNRAPANMPTADQVTNQPSIEDPRELYAFAMRADICGFTQKVSDSFLASEEDRKALAAEFVEIMRACKEFATRHELDVIQLPWGGDSFNLLIQATDREELINLRKRTILVFAKEFEDFIKQKYPLLDWSFSIAAGDIENAQVCNTLVSRLKMGDITRLLGTGTPLHRSFEGQIKGGAGESQGTLFHEDVGYLDSDLAKVTSARADVRFYHLFKVDEIRQCEQFKPAPAAYTAPAAVISADIITPTVRNHYQFSNQNNDTSLSSI